jgi:signal transduction histidine kinase/ligand-binding sensor domain-containing protein
MLCMPRWPIALLVFAALVLLEACPVGAQVRIRRNLTVDDGLAQSQVLTLFEDRDGYLWAGTNDGVSRFDGSRFTTFQSSHGLPPGPVRAVRQSADGALFFATDRGVSIYRDGRFTPPPADSGLGQGQVASLALAADGTLYFVRPNEVAVRHPDGRYERLAVRGLPAKPWLMAALPARDGTLFLGGEAGAFAVHSGEALPLSNDAGDTVFAIHQARNGTIRFGTDQGLSVLRGGSLETVPDIPGPVLHIAEGSGGTLYVSTHSGVFLLRGSGLDRITTANGLGWDQVHAVTETRDGAVYIATERGIGIYDRGLVESWTPETGLPDGVVWSIDEDARGETWLGTGKGMAHLRDGRWESFLPDQTVRAVVAGRDGRVYAGSQQTGLSILEGGRIRSLDGLPDRFVRALWEAPDGAIWIGMNQGLAVLRGDRLRTLEGLPHPTITSFAGGPDGSVWIGTLGGLVLWRDRVVRVWTERDGLADDVVWSILPGRDSSVYLGTAHGVSVLRDGRFRTIDARGPRARLTNDTVYCLLEDGAGRVYASTNRGVNILDLRAEPTVAGVLERNDGLASIEGNVGACHRDARGRLWFGNVSGVSLYDPAREAGTRQAPRVRIAGVRLFDRELPPAGMTERRFGHRDNYFQFAFAGIDHAAPHRVRYRYRLAGLDRGWTETDRGSVQYTNLDPGRYRFQVQAASGSGPWSAAAEMPFTIRTPIWRRWWFVLLAALALGSAVALVLALRVRQLLALERLRTAIAADLHDHIGAGLTEIAILSEIVAHRTGGSPELGKVADTARQLLDKMNEIVWLVNPRRDSLHDLFVRLKDSYSELFSHAGVLFRASNLALFERVRLPMSYRENLYLIFKEALNNSLRHSGCQEIELSVALQGRRLEIVLRDDGRGFDPEGDGQGNGLGNMKSRAERIGGRLSIEAEQGGGTAIRFVGALP